MYFPALAMGATATPGFWAHPLVVGVATLIIGAPLTYILAYLHFRRHRPRKALRCRTTYCCDFLTPTAAGVGDLQIRLSGQELINPTVISFEVASVGNTPIENVRMRVDAGPTDKIVRRQIYVSDLVQCERITERVDSARSMRCTWEYINPKDVVEIVLLVAPCKSPECVTFEIDAQGVEVERSAMLSDCSLATKL